MKDLYEVLGLTKDASISEIKKTYRELAAIFHPDKEGGDTEKMVLINEAKEILSNPDRRRDYDARWHAFQESKIDQEADIVIKDYLEKFDTPAYSKIFLNEHKSLVRQYELKSLNVGSLLNNFQPFKTCFYHFENSDGTISDFHDVFAFINHKMAHKDKISSSMLPPRGRLSPILAAEVLIDFLSGNYYDEGLTSLKKYLISQIEEIKLGTHQESTLLLYEGILEIVLNAELKSSDQYNLIISMKKISDFSKICSDLELSCILPLFYNKYFRNLYAYSMHLYWFSNKSLFSAENLKQFDGQKEAEELLEILRGRMLDSRQNDNLASLIKCVKLFYILEKDLDTSKNTKTAVYYRDKAFHLLDWIPALSRQANSKITMNFFLQIGINFQQASQLEMNPAVKMADEKMALKMYLTCIGIGHHSTPDVKLYAYTHALKYIAAFRFQDPLLEEVIPALQKRALLIADVFPIFEGPQSNITLLKQEDKSIQLMRRLLNAMMECLEYNKTHSDSITIDHSSVTVLYQVYEACLKNWYQEKYDPDTEKKIRRELMEELLFENGWTFLDVDQNVDSPWIMVNRDDQGWMKPSRSLPYKVDVRFTQYRAIHGAEINGKTGEITFYLDPWKEKHPEYEKTFTIFDLQEMLEKNLASAIFSLDPVDPEKPYHPFNVMRFAPPTLCDSELFNTMLLTDYILKFLTTNQEVQGQYPYEQRPIDHMIQHLPKYLREIIDNFHRAEHSGEVHRFWIEAEEMDIVVSDLEIKSDNITRIGLCDLKMIVKKHKMKRDIHGELKDVGNEDEGWPIYILTSQEIEALRNGHKEINDRAMIFIYQENKLFYWENNKIIKEHVPEDFRETLIRLYKQPKDSEGKVKQNSKNMPLMYRVIKTMASQAGLSHRYSPEFIFAHEFTVHYDEFAQYLPEFGRLKELSKISILVRFLNGVRLSNKEHIKCIKKVINGSTIQTDTDIYNTYLKAHQEVCKNVTSIFHKLQSEIATDVLLAKWKEKLTAIKNQMGSLYFSYDSEEVTKACQQWHDEISRKDPSIPSWRIWNEVINPKREEVAKTLSITKQTNWQKQLTEIFSPLLESSLGAYKLKGLINSFMRGDIYPLAHALVEQEKTKAQEDIVKQFPNSQTLIVILALEGVSDAVERVAWDESYSQLQEVKKPKEILESGFVQIGLGKEQTLADVKGRCFWVPASVRHEMRGLDTSGLPRHSFFMYGGVSIQPNLNIVRGGGGPLAGAPVGSGGFNRGEIIRGFQSHHIISPTNPLTQSHQLLKLAGFTNLDARANRMYLPTQEGQHPTRSIHSGRHTTEAMNRVADAMDKIVEKGKAQTWSQAQYHEGLRRILSDLRQDLRAGNVALNAKQRPWSS